MHVSCTESKFFLCISPNISNVPLLFFDKLGPLAIMKIIKKFPVWVPSRSEIKLQLCPKNHRSLSSQHFETRQDISYLPSIFFKDLLLSCCLFLLRAALLLFFSAELRTYFLFFSFSYFLLDFILFSAMLKIALWVKTSAMKLSKCAHPRSTIGLTILRIVRECNNGWIKVQDNSDQLRENLNSAAQEGYMLKRKGAKYIVPRERTDASEKIMS